MLQKISTRLELVVIIVVVMSVSIMMSLPHAYSESNTNAESSNQINSTSNNVIQFNLKINDTYSQDSGALKIKLLNITSDNRCPMGAMCVMGLVEGHVTVLMGINQDTQDLGNFTLSSLQGKNQLVFGNHTLTLMQVSPFRMIGKEIAPSDYRITFALSDTKNVDDVSIVNVQVHPMQVRVGDNFTITATLVNNSPNIINVHNDCLSPFSVDFDSHAKIEVAKPCIYFAISLPLNPGENRTGTGPGSNLMYRAVEAGTANATVTYSYTVGNQIGSNLAFVSNPVNISKSVSFAILSSSNQTTVIPPPLAQVKSGILVKDVKCMSGLQLVFKADDGSPACVTQDTFGKLVSRGWAAPPNYIP